MGSSMMPQSSHCNINRNINIIKYASLITGERFSVPWELLPTDFIIHNSKSNNK